MQVDVLLGLQWGDEGKGKVVDFLAPQYEVVARFQGGPNAGHTLEFDGVKHVLHQIPSGIFRKGIINVVGNGVVIDPVIFSRELNDLAALAPNAKEDLFISRKAALILPTHRLLDEAYELAKGDKKIGSTKRGIGPTYADKISRQGLRIGDIERSNFEVRLKQSVDRLCEILDRHQHEYDLAPLMEKFMAAIAELRTLKLVDSEYLVNRAMGSGKRVLAEGAQGSLLDIDFGSYPFVTSSNTTSAGVISGLGVAPKTIGDVFGIFKAYCTRVGAGPFPTELFDEDGEAMRVEGNEFGATTGRPRRCGWLDLPALQYAVMINGVTQLFMMKADVLSIFKEIKVCTGYRLDDGRVITDVPYDTTETRMEPVYETLPGWNTDLTEVTDYASFPAQLKAYVEYIEQKVGVPIKVVSVGPDRTQTVNR